MIAQIISSVLHVVLCIFIVSKYDLGVSGIGIATMITYFCMYLFTEVYAHFIPAIKPAIQCPNKDTFAGWGDYLSISLPATVMLLAEGWAFNVLGVLAGLISVTDQAVNTIMLMIISIMFMVPMGVQSASCAIIGEQIGAGRVALAKEYFRLMSLICLVMLLVVQMLFYFFREPIIRSFTTDLAVEQLAHECFFIVVLAFIPDMVQGSLQGVIRALGIQQKASYIALACFYLVSIPVACTLVFVCDLGVSGLWIGIGLGIFLIAVFYTRLVIYGTNWQEVALEAAKRM